MTTTQLRDYKVAEGKWDEFIAAWTAQVPPLRAARGFTIEAWASAEVGRLVWFLSYPGGVEEFEAADRAYYNSPERLAFTPDPRDFLVSSDHHFVERLGLTPG